MEKGGKRTTSEPGLLFKTNFNDWSDPQPKHLKKRKKRICTVLKKQKIENEPIVLSDMYVEINQIRQHIRERRPLLSEKEIRSIKLPFYQSLLVNLLEDGFPSTSEFISDLLVMDDQYYKQKQYMSVIKEIPHLKTDNYILSLLANGLTKAETANKEGNKTKEARAFLDLALIVSQLENKAWHWLAQELFEQCIELIEKNKIDQQFEATAKHLYSSFLFNSLYDLQLSKFYVENSMALSEGKSWTINEITGKTYLLYNESSFLLHKIYLAMAHETDDTDEAIQLCKNSLLWSRRMDSKESEATALINLVNIYLKNNMLRFVLHYLENYIRICKEENTVERLCEGYVLLSSYHEKMGDHLSVIADIQELLKVAEKNQVIKIMALAHHKLAVNYLIHDNQKEMEYHAIEAYRYYVDLNQTVKIEETRCLIGIAQAKLMFSEYINILLEAETLESLEFNNIIIWKTLRLQFFSGVKLFQPETEINLQLRDKIESLKIEEFLTQKNRDNEMSITQVQSQFLLTSSKGWFPSVMSHMEVIPKQSKSIKNSQRNMRRSILSRIHQNFQPLHMNKY